MSTNAVVYNDGVSGKPVITSLLDTDLYKLTMQAAVLDHFPNTNVEYRLNNRTADKKLNAEAIEWLRNEVKALGDLSLSNDELDFLKKNTVLPQRHLDYLQDFRFSPEKQVEIVSNLETHEFEIIVKGNWVETILYEIPLLALTSEAYFRFVDTDWNYEGQAENAKAKTVALLNNGCIFSEFGSRRRRSKETQRLVVKAISEAAKEIGKDNLISTSNVYFGKEFGLKVTGTVAHEWMMGVAAATQDYVHANKRSMELWIKTIGKENAGVALTDTFGTDDFLKYLVPPFSDIYDGVRQDSGDPEVYTKLLSDHFSKLGYASGTKKIVYSDSLDVEKCEKYKKVAEKAGLVPLFGIGTFFTNDFKHISANGKSEPLNIVIKISNVDGYPAIKLSDNIGKHTGDPATVKRVKQELGYIQRDWKEGDESHRWSATVST